MYVGQQSRDLALGLLGLARSSVGSLTLCIIVDSTFLFDTIN